MSDRRGESDKLLLGPNPDQLIRKDIIQEIRRSRTTGPKITKRSSEIIARVTRAKSQIGNSTVNSARSVLGLEAKPFPSASELLQQSLPPLSAPHSYSLPSRQKKNTTPSTSTSSSGSVEVRSGTSLSDFNVATRPRGIPVSARVKVRLPNSWSKLTKRGAKLDRGPNVRRRRITPSGFRYMDNAPPLDILSNSRRDGSSLETKIAPPINEKTKINNDKNNNSNNNNNDNLDVDEALKKIAKRRRGRRTSQVLQSFAQEEGITMENVWEEIDKVFGEVHHNSVGKKAVSKYYLTDGSFEWRPCVVISYDDDRKYRVRWTKGSAKHKWVTRANLRFENETEIEWSRRKMLLQILERAKSQQIARMDWMAHVLPVIEKIDMKTGASSFVDDRYSKPRYIAVLEREFGSENKYPLQIQNELSAELRALHERAHLLSSLFHKYKELKCAEVTDKKNEEEDEEEEDGVETTKLLQRALLDMGIRPPKPQKKRFFTLPPERRMGGAQAKRNPSELFLKRRRFIQREAIRAADPSTLSALREIHALNLVLLEDCHQHQKQKSITDSIIGGGERSGTTIFRRPEVLPTYLKTFVDLQKSSAKQFRNRLKFQWYTDIRHIVSDLFEHDQGVADQQGTDEKKKEKNGNVYNNTENEDDCHAFYHVASAKMEEGKNARKARLLMLVRLMMGCTVHEAVTANVNDLVKLFDSPKYNDGILVPGSKLARPSVFKVNISLARTEDGKYNAVFEPKLNDYADAVTECVIGIVRACQDFPCIDAAVLNDATYEDLTLHVMEETNPFITDILKGLSRNLRQDFANAILYVDCLDTCNVMMKQYENRSAYAERLAASRDLTAVASVKAEVALHREKSLSVHLSLPTERRFVFLTVIQKRFKDELTNAADGLANAVLEWISNAAAKQAASVRKEFRDFTIKLRTEPSSPDDLMVMLAFVKELPGRVEEMQILIEEIRRQFDILDHFFFPISRSIFKLRWELLSMPSKTLRRLSRTRQSPNHHLHKYRPQLYSRRAIPVP